MKKNVYKVGDTLEYRRLISPEDVAEFHGEVIHPVYATFALARDAEWTSRQFVPDLCEENEEGIGTMLSIEHRSPAFIGEEIVFRAKVQTITQNELICVFEATVGDRLIATGKTGQKILKLDALEKLFYGKVIDKRRDKQ